MPFLMLAASYSFSNLRRAYLWLEQQSLEKDEDMMLELMYHFAQGKAFCNCHGPRTSVSDVARHEEEVSQFAMPYQSLPL